MDEPEAQDVAVLITRLRQSAMLPYAHGDLLREAATALEAQAREIARVTSERDRLAADVFKLTEFASAHRSAQPGQSCLTWAREQIESQDREIRTLRNIAVTADEKREASLVDAERLDWMASLRQFEASPANWHVARAAAKTVFSWMTTDPVQTVRADTLREAIDAARVPLTGQDGKA